MSGLTFVFTIAGDLAIAIFLVGFIARVWKYANTPSPSKIALTSASAGAAGVVGRMAQGIKHTRLLFTATAFEVYAGILFLSQIPALFTLRLPADRIHYFSAISDYLHLVLLTGIAATGRLAETFLRAEIISVKKFVVGLITLSPEAMPGDIVFRMKH